MQNQVDIDPARFPASLTLPTELVFDLLDPLPDYPNTQMVIDPNDGI
jgi:hypothetical protein